MFFIFNSLFLYFHIFVFFVIPGEDKDKRLNRRQWTFVGVSVLALIAAIGAMSDWGDSIDH